MYSLKNSKFYLEAALYESLVVHGLSIRNRLGYTWQVWNLQIGSRGFFPTRNSQRAINPLG